MIRLFFVKFLLLACIQFGSAQSTYIPLNQDYQHLLERYEIKSGSLLPQFHSHIKPYQRKIAAYLADSIWSNVESLSKVDEFNLDYLKNDSWEWSSTANADSQKPIFRSLYKKKADFFSYQDKNFDLHINPVLYGIVGREKDFDKTPYLNTRGLEVRGMLRRKLGFYTFFTDTQATFPTYISDKIRQLDAVPNEGFYKANQEQPRNGVDFLTARGYITFEAIRDIINIQFGYDKNFIGNGYRSLILSDFSSNYLFLKFNTNVWKFNYQNIFAQLTAETLNGDGFYPQKFFALHHLSFNVNKNLNIGVFESIVFNRGDSSSIKGYDLRYLNPLIFYRSIEQQAGSPDNANLGLDFKWHFLKRFALYGQVLIDEFLIGDVRRWNGSVRNKQAFQVGMKYIDVVNISNLDLHLELNAVRPYTYSHNFRFAEYSNYNQPLAHPLGANFYEWIGVVRYQPISRLNMTGKLIYARYGEDENTLNGVLQSNYGGNIFLNNTGNFPVPITQEGNQIAQGIETRLTFLDFTASYQLKHNIFIDFKQIIRKIDSQLDARDKTTIFSSLVFRWNIAQRLNEY